MTGSPMRNRPPLRVWKDAASGASIGLGAALLLSIWVLFVDSNTQGGIEERYDVSTWALVGVYFGGLGFSGACGGFLRPWLGTLVGQVVLCWVTAFALYGGVQLIMPPLFGNALFGGVMMATIATPIWLLVVRVLPADRNLRAAAGLPPRRGEAPPSPQELWIVYRSIPGGGSKRVRSCLGQEAAEREAERLRALGFEHRYWVERA